MKRQSTSKLLRLMVAVFALFLLVMAGSVLSACGGTTVSELHKHTYGQPEHKDTATCGATGYDVYTCTECGDKYAIVTAATGKHTFENGVCKVCGISTVGYDDSEVQSKLQQILDKINANAETTTTPENAHTHDFKEDTKLNVSKTCLTFGLKVGKCACGSTAVLELTPAEGHHYSGTEELEKIAPTCTTDGQIKVTCDLCHDEFWMVDPEARALGHDFQRTTTEFDKPANCITPELRAYVCTRCGEKHYEEYDKINPERHADTMDREDKNSWVETWQKWEAPAEGSEDTIVPEALKTKPSDYNYSTSTLETYYGKCEKCGQYTWKQKTVNCEHSWKALDENIAPGCEEDGWFNAVCENCGVYANQLPGEGSTDTELKFTDTDKIGARTEENNGFVKNPMTGHDYDESSLKDFYEVDRDPATGKVITDSNIMNPDGSKKGSNTTRWQGTTCKNCDKEIVVGNDGEDKIVKYLLRKTADQKPDVDNEYYKEVKEKLFLREWHAWQLYEGTEIKVDSKTLTPPAGAKAPVEATCLDPGLEWYYCIDESCKQLGEGNGRWISIDLLPLGHDWDLENPTVVAPTCTKAGTVTYVCKRTNGKEGEAAASRCGHHTETNGTVTYDTNYATITFSIDSNKYNEIVNAEDWTWNAKYRTRSTDGKDTWDPDYLKKWGADGVWTATCGKTSDTTGSVTAPTTDDKSLCGENVLDDFKLNGTIKNEVLQKFMPQAHLWEKDEVETNKLGTPKCFDGHATVYKCVCAMSGSDCCTDETAEGDGKCPSWTEKSAPEHLKNENDELDVGTYYIYGKCTDGGDSNEHGIIEVKYCLHCGYEISRRNTMDKNHRHFPFNRNMIEGLLVGHMPAEGEEPGKKMSEEDVAARLEYANVWICIHEWWFMDNMDNTYATDLVPYLYTKSDITGATEGYQILCFDCFNPAYTYYGSIYEAHKCKGFKGADLETVYYAYDAESRKYIEITDETRDTYNSCEYAYYVQYVKTCPDCKHEFRFANADGTGIGRYTRLTVETKDGETINGTPTGEHYLIPAKDYWEKDNFNADLENNEITMDWVCVFCGKTFELKVKYDDGSTASATDAAETETDTSTVKLVDANDKLHLLVDTKGIKFGTKDAPGFNERWGKNGANLNKDADRLLQMNNKPIFGKNVNVKAEGEESEAETGKVTNENQLAYAWQGTVVMQADNDSTGIFVAHRRTDTPANNGVYFESTTAVWMTSNALTGSVLRLQDFVDATDEAAYSAAWDAKFGITDDMTDEQKKASNKALDAMFKQGGEIVLGGNIGEAEKAPTVPEGKFESTGFGTMRPDGSFVQTNDQDTPETKYNVFLLSDGETIDLNGHTFYGNVIAWGGDTIQGVKAGKSVIKNGKIVLESKGRMQVSSQNSTDNVSLELDGVEVTGGRTGLFMGTYGSVTIKNSSIMSEGYAISTNNAETNGKATNWVLEDSAFISTKATAFFMPGEGSVDAKGCEFYGYDMGVFLRGDNLEEQEDELVTKRAAAMAISETVKSHARFVDCLFTKGNQSSGAGNTNSGTVTKHYGALTIGNDNGASKTAYGSIKDLVLRNCNFGIVKVAKNEEVSTGSVATDVWTPATEENNKGDLNLGATDSDFKAECDTSTSGTKCTESTCCHRAIVINICGCSTLGEGQDHNCMTKDDECNEQCTSDQYGRVTIDMDTATFNNLVAHAQKFSHTTEAADGTINPFLGCTFTDGFELKGKCCKLKIYIDGNKTDFNWLQDDGTTATVSD